MVWFLFFSIMIKIFCMLYCVNKMVTIPIKVTGFNNGKAQRGECFILFVIAWNI